MVRTDSQTGEAFVQCNPRRNFKGPGCDKAHLSNNVVRATKLPTLRLTYMRKLNSCISITHLPPPSVGERLPTPRRHKNTRMHCNSYDVWKRQEKAWKLSQHHCSRSARTRNVRIVCTHHLVNFITRKRTTACTQP